MPSIYLIVECYVEGADMNEPSPDKDLIVRNLAERLSDSAMVGVVEIEFDAKGLIDTYFVTDEFTELAAKYLLEDVQDTDDLPSWINDDRSEWVLATYAFDAIPIGKTDMKEYIADRANDEGR